MHVYVCVRVVVCEYEGGKSCVLLKLCLLRNVSFQAWFVALVHLLDVTARCNCYACAHPLCQLALYVGLK